MGKGRETRQKRLIGEAMEGLATFFDAETLHRRVAASDKSVGIATVYRHLKALCSEGKVHSYLCGRRTVYSLDERNHCHFTCEKCGSIAHIRVKNLGFLGEELRKGACHFQIDVTGICGKCRKGS